MLVQFGQQKHPGMSVCAAAVVGARPGDFSAPFLSDVHPYPVTGAGIPPWTYRRPDWGQALNPAGEQGLSLTTGARLLTELRDTDYRSLIR